MSAANFGSWNKPTSAIVFYNMFINLVNGSIILPILGKRWTFLLSNEDTQPQTLLNMMEEGFVVVILAETLESIISIFKRKNIMKKQEAVRKNIVRAAQKLSRKLVYHWTAIALVYAAHLFIPGGTI